LAVRPPAPCAPPPPPTRRASDFLRPHSLEKSAVWGGASKGVLFSLMMERAGADVELVIDINPAKQNRYLPASGLQVTSPEVGLADRKSTRLNSSHVKISYAGFCV